MCREPCKVLVFSECKSRPATGSLQPVAIEATRGGNETVGAFETDGSHGDSAYTRCSEPGLPHPFLVESTLISTGRVRRTGTLSGLCRSETCRRRCVQRRPR